MIRRSVAAYRILTSKTTKQYNIDASWVYLVEPPQPISDFAPSEHLPFQYTWFNDTLTKYQIDGKYAVKIGDNEPQWYIPCYLLTLDLLMPGFSLFVAAAFFSWYTSMMGIGVFMLSFITWWLFAGITINTDVVARRKALYHTCGLDFGGYPKPKDN